MRNPNLTFIKTALTEIGAPIPDVFTRTEEQVQKITSAHRELVENRTYGYAAIADAWANAVLDDRDPATDPGIIRALVASALADGDIGYAAGNIAEQRLAEEIPAILPQIMAAFSKAVNEAGAKLTAAHEILGDTQLSEIHTIHNLGPAALQASINAQEGNRTIRLIDNAWRALAETTAFAPAGTTVLVRLTTPDVNQWDKLRNVKDAWTFVQHGLTLTLATTGQEVQKREQHIATTRAQRDAARDADATKARTQGLRFR